MINYVGFRLKMLRECVGYTQKQMAEVLGYADPRSIQAIEAGTKGKKTQLQEQKITILSLYFDVPSDFILGIFSQQECHAILATKDSNYAKRIEDIRRSASRTAVTLLLDFNSREEVASEIGVHPLMLSMYEQGAIALSLIDIIKFFEMVGADYIAEYRNLNIAYPNLLLPGLDPSDIRK